MSEYGFKDGSSYTFKVKRTTFNLIYEKTYDWYRFETKTSRSFEVSYILYKQLDLCYRLMTKDVDKKPEIVELTSDEVKDKNDEFRSLFNGKNN